jgi:hypothetical protein
MKKDIRQFRIVNLGEGFRAVQDQDEICVMVCSRYFWTKSWNIVDCRKIGPTYRLGSKYLGDAGEAKNCILDGDRPLLPEEMATPTARVAFCHSFKSVQKHMREAKEYWNTRKEPRLPADFLYVDGEHIMTTSRIYGEQYEAEQRERRASKRNRSAAQG